MPPIEGQGVKPRVIHVIPHDGVGGVEVAARSMARRDDLACEFILLLIAGRSLEPATGRTVESPFRSALNPFALLRAVTAIARLQPEVLIFSLWRSVPVALLTRLVSPRTRLACFINLDRPAHAVDAVLSRIAMFASHEIWADSAATLQARVRTSAKPSRVVSFVTDRLASPTPASDRPAARFVSWSRLNRQKGIDLALTFIASLKSRGISPQFDVWGPDDGELKRLKALARELRIEEAVAFRGPAQREALGAIAAGASFFLQLSRSEGMAMATVEAMQLGLIPVVTAVGEMARYVSDGSNGIIVDPSRMSEGADKLASVLADPRRYRQMRQQTLSYWAGAPLYADDVCRAACEMADQRQPFNLNTAA